MKSMWFIFLGALWISLSSPGLAQEGHISTMSAQFLHCPVIDAGTTGFVDTLPVCSSQSLHVSLYLPSNTFLPTLTTPAGEVLSWNLEAETHSCHVDAFEVEPGGAVTGYVYHFYVPTPANGNWTLHAKAPAALSRAWKAIVNVDLDSKVRAGLFLANENRVVGETAHVSLLVLDGKTAVMEPSYTATWTHLENATTQPATFAPMSHPRSGQPTLVNAFTPTASGTYCLQVIVKGETPDGPYERHAMVRLKVYPKKVKILDNVANRLELRFP